MGTTCLGRWFSFSNASKGTGQHDRGQTSLRAFAKYSGTTALTGLCLGGKNELHVSAHQETANMIYRQYGDDGNIRSPPQIVALPFEVESVIFFKPIWSDGCETLFSQLNAQSEVNGGAVPNIQCTKCSSSCVLFWSVVRTPSKDLTRWLANSTFLLLVVELFLMGGQRCQHDITNCSCGYFSVGWQDG